MTITGVMSMAVMAINAQATAIGNISDNVANAGTPGYKAVNTLFHDMVLGQRPGGGPVLDSGRPGGVIAYADFANRKGGTIVSDVDNPTSAAVSGNGFFPVAKPTGFDAVTGEPTGFETEVYYTRQGDFHLDSSGRLVNGAGYYLMAAAPSGTGAPRVMTVDTGDNAAGSGFAGVSIGDGGLVTVTYDDKSTADIGQILLANFREPDELDRIDGTAFRVTGNSGDAVYGNPRGANQAGVGTIKGSALEQSTVDTGDQMTQLIIAQQAYSMNSQVLKAANEMMSTVVSLKG